MEELFESLAGFLPIIFIAIVGTIAKKAANTSKAQQAAHQQQAMRQQAMNQARPSAMQSAPVARPAQPTAPASMASMLPQQPASAQPTVHTHLAPDCETHDAPTNGSLGFTSTEGKDPCHEDQLIQQRDPLVASETARPALTLDWNGDALVKAFVMQEVLTRPCDRRR